MPPLGSGRASWVTCGLPLPSKQRTVKVCLPLCRGLSQRHTTQVWPDTGVRRSAGIHSPLSRRRSTFDMPRTPAWAMPPMGIPISRVGPAIIMFVACKEHPSDVPGKTAVPKHTDYCHDGIDFLHALLYHGGVVAEKLRPVVNDEACVLQETQIAIWG